MRIRVELLLILFSFLAAPAFALKTEVTVSCFRAREGGEPYRYCIHKAVPSTNADVVYFLHGIGGNVNSWQNTGYFEKIYQAWGDRAPTVVSISYGTYWFLAEKNRSKFSGLYEHFTQVALPSVEKALHLIPKRRLLIGASMGGFNASQLYLKNPSLFSKVLLVCPAISEIGPHSSPSDIEAYIQRTHADPEWVERSLWLIKLFFPNKEAWATADPLTLAGTLTNPTYPRLLISTGLQDQFGFFDGSQQFTDIVRSRGATVNYLPVQGQHCSWDWQASVSFLVDP